MGIPKKDPILQMSDFVTYLPWLYWTTNGNARDRLDSLIDNFYNLKGTQSRSGFVIL